MHLKYLSLCLLGLGLSACTQHAVHSSGTNKSLEQRAVQGLSAMYEYSGYDYRGKIKVNVDQTQLNQTNNLKDSVQPNPEVQQKLDRYLQAQQIKLDRKQKQTLYAAIVKEQGQQGASGHDRLEKMNAVMANLLNDMQFSYDGSIHYRQKIGSFNLTARYEKPTLLVQAKLPMILDLNDYKLYMNYFGLMPYMVNKDNQNNLAYIDFSKYQHLFKRVDMKKFVEYSKASGAVTYRLAKPQDLQQLSVSTAEKQAGIVEKIRLKGSIEELLLQMDLYGQVNQHYLEKSVLGFDDQSMAESIAAELIAAEAEKQAQKVAKEQSSVPADDAAAVSQQLYTLVNQHFGGSVRSDDADVGDVTDDETIAAEEEATTAAEAVAQSTSTEDQDAALLDREQCLALQTSVQQPEIGDVNYCQTNYAVNVLDQTSADSQVSQLDQKKQALMQKFAAYDQNQFIDDEAFQTLWLKHQSEIEQALPEKRNPILIDVGLDAQGRAVQIDYDVAYQPASLKYRFKVQADMQILNYGQATPIDRQQLKQAKSVTEASKGSMFEKLVTGLGSKLGQGGVTEHPVEPYSDIQHWDDVLAQLADQTYDQTHSYVQTYKTVFIAKLSAEKPQYVQRYSTQALQEIAEVYAYWFSAEGVYDPKGKELEHIQALQKKHHLEQDAQFDEKLGAAIDHVVITTMDGKKGREAWQKLQKQYKQPQQLFAQQYQLQFEQQNGISTEEKSVLRETADILGQVYVAARKQQLTEKTIQALKAEHNEYIDYDVFREVYQKMLTAKK